VDIDGHPPFLTSSKNISGNFSNLLFLAGFRVLNFQNRFNALNGVFWKNGEQRGTKIDVSQTKVVFLEWIFLTVYRAPKTKIVCKSYDSGKLTYQVPPSGPTNLLAFHLPVLGFWIFLTLKRLLEPHCNNYLLVSASSCHISSHR
jgi:hypothetical protein